MLYALEQPCKKKEEEIDMNLPQETCQKFPPIFVSHLRTMSSTQLSPLSLQKTAFSTSDLAAYSFCLWFWKDEAQTRDG